MLDTILLIIAIIVLLAVAFLAYTISQRFHEFRNAQAQDKSLLMLNQNLNSMNDKIDQTQKDINSRLDNAAKVIYGVQKELGTVQERFKSFEEFSDLLHPKLRGNIGEQILEDMLAQAFSPEHYQMQYRFKDNAVVDAIIRTRGGIIPIDSKFPLENFKQMNRAETEAERKAKGKEFAKAVRKHIDDIAKKYILPEEGTVNFAVMYVPSENVYYHILTDEASDILEHAKKRSVFLVSPQSFFSLVRVIFLGLERAKIQEQAQRILDTLKGVQVESKRFGDVLNVAAKHVGNAKNAMDSTVASYGKLTGKLDQIQLMEHVPLAEPEKVTLAESGNDS